jgi:hypothetical protein
MLLLLLLLYGERLPPTATAHSRLRCSPSQIATNLRQESLYR